MSDAWLIESWSHLMGHTDDLLTDVRAMAATMPEDGAIQQLLSRAEQQRNDAEAALRTLSEQRVALQKTLDELQSRLAVNGHPLRGEVS
jgi:geranylgeranyl pyrophosphate synthase